MIRVIVLVCRRTRMACILMVMGEDGVYVIDSTRETRCGMWFLM
jgi:hypothetical protein